MATWNAHKHRESASGCKGAKRCNLRCGAAHIRPGTRGRACRVERSDRSLPKSGDGTCVGACGRWEVARSECRRAYKVGHSPVLSGAGTHWRRKVASVGVHLDSIDDSGIGLSHRPERPVFGASTAETHCREKFVSFDDGRIWVVSATDQGFWSELKYS